jgi:hypothetical protein
VDFGLGLGAESAGCGYLGLIERSKVYIGYAKNKVAQRVLLHHFDPCSRAWPCHAPTLTLTKHERTCPHRATQPAHEKPFPPTTLDTRGVP